MAQKIISKNLRHQALNFSEVIELLNSIITENSGYMVTSSIVLPNRSSSIHGGTAISTAIVEYKCSFILTEGTAHQLVVEKRIRNEKRSNGTVEFSEIGQVMKDIISEHPNYEITSSIVIEKESSELIGRGTIISKTVGYDCCFILTRN